MGDNPADLSLRFCTGPAGTQGFRVDLGILIFR